MGYSYPVNLLTCSVHLNFGFVAGVDNDPGNPVRVSNLAASKDHVLLFYVGFWRRRVFVCVCVCVFLCVKMLAIVMFYASTQKQIHVSCLYNEINLSRSIWEYTITFLIENVN